MQSRNTGKSLGGKGLRACGRTWVGHCPLRKVLRKTTKRGGWGRSTSRRVVVDAHFGRFAQNGAIGSAISVPECPNVGVGGPPRGVMPAYSGARRLRWRRD